MGSSSFFGALLPSSSRHLLGRGCRARAEILRLRGGGSNQDAHRIASQVLLGEWVEAARRAEGERFRDLAEKVDVDFN